MYLPNLMFSSMLAEACIFFLGLIQLTMDEKATWIDKLYHYFHFFKRKFNSIQEKNCEK